MGQMRSNLTSEVTGGHYGGRPIEAKPLDVPLSNFVCIPSGPLPSFWACQILGRGCPKSAHYYAQNLKMHFLGRRRPPIKKLHKIRNVSHPQIIWGG